MPKVICHLPNFDDEVSGVKFVPHPDGGKISEEISEEQAELFASIPGYELAEPVKAPPKGKDKGKPAPAADATPPAGTEGEGGEVF